MRKRLGLWPYVLAGVVSWYGFAQSGIAPGARAAAGGAGDPARRPRLRHLFAEAERYLHDLLNVMEHALKIPVEIVLFLFGLANAGVEFGAIGAPTWLVLAGLLIGKPVGHLALRLARGAARSGSGLPAGMRIVDLIVIGVGGRDRLHRRAVHRRGGLPAGPVQDAAKMGALFSFRCRGVAILAGQSCCGSRNNTAETGAESRVLFPTLATKNGDFRPIFAKFAREAVVSDGGISDIMAPKWGTIPER